jgi:2-keto-4-pentenoate hydratase
VQIAGVDQPDFGMLFDDMAFADGETIPACLLQPKVEAGSRLLERDLDREGLC